MSDRIYADLQKLDRNRRVMLTTFGTRRDLEARGIVLRNGLRLAFYSSDDMSGERDDLLFEGTVLFDEERRVWVAEINWDAVRHESDLPSS
jgi:hypothetical protein